MRQKIIRKKDVKFINTANANKSDLDSYLMFLRNTFSEFAERFRKHNGKLIVKVVDFGKYELDINIKNSALKNEMKRHFLHSDILPDNLGGSIKD